MPQKYPNPKLNQEFDQWTVIDETIVYNKQSRKVLCKCSCNRVEKLISVCDLYREKTKRCKKCTNHRPPKYQSYVTNNRLNRIWNNMIQRCMNNKNKDYKHYGDNGVIICDEWVDYGKFEKWALENGYRDDLEIDRKDSEGNYEPDNCRWITHQQNVWNMPKRKNCSSKYKGVHYNKQNSNWCASIAFNGKKINIGSFKTEVEAALAYNEKAIKFFGEYAYLNKIEENNDSSDSLGS